MDRDTAAVTHFSQPIRQIVSMLLAIGLLLAGIWLIRDVVAGILSTNLELNGFIVGVFLLGVLTCFWQVFILIQSVSWIDAFVRHNPGAEEASPPRLLAPLAQLLRSRGAKSQITSSSARSILESVATRIDEARDITRYLTNLLIFLGLLGTFYGLATTVPAVVDTIRSLAPEEGETGMQVFAKLMGGLESQLGGMGTAFSSSLLGLAGSLVVGLLELFASHGQSRFYRELEEWLSSITRLGFAGIEGEGGGGGGADQGVLAQVLDNMTGQIEVLQALYSQAEANREGAEDRIGELARAVAGLAKRLEGERGQAETLLRIAEGQEKLVAVLTAREVAAAGAGGDAESRMRLRSIDVQLLRILEELAAGRQETVADLRAELHALTQALRAVTRPGAQPVQGR